MCLSIQVLTWWLVLYFVCFHEKLAVLCCSNVESIFLNFLKCSSNVQCPINVKSSVDGVGESKVSLQNQIVVQL